MTRNVLKSLEGKRFHCRAKVDRFGSKRAFRGAPIKTILLKDVIDPGTSLQLTDHLWFTAGKWSADVQVGDVIEFDARATEYIKGYRGRRDDALDAPPVSVDWRLERPTKVKIVGRAGDCPLFGDDLKALGTVPAAESSSVQL